jgi:GDP-L-fucose synthase
MGDVWAINAWTRLLAAVLDCRGELVCHAAMPDGTPRQGLAVSRRHRLGWRVQTSWPQDRQQTHDWFSQNSLRGRHYE